MGRRYDTVVAADRLRAADEFVGVCHAVMLDVAPQSGSSTSPTTWRRSTSRGGLAGARARGAVPPRGRRARRRRSRCRHGPPLAIAVEVEHGVSSAPTTGCSRLRSPCSAAPRRVVALTNAEYQLPSPGPTFAGRDVMAPAAAHLANGVDLWHSATRSIRSRWLPGHHAVARVEEATHRRRGAVGRSVRQLPAQRRPRGPAIDVDRRRATASAVPTVDPSGGDVRRVVRASSFAALGSGRAGAGCSDSLRHAGGLPRQGDRRPRSSASRPATQVLLAAALDDELPDRCRRGPSGAGGGPVAFLPVCDPTTSTFTLFGSSCWQRS